MIKVGSDFSGVGAFDQALQRLGIAYETIFACDNDKYARETYVENYGQPTYFPKDVYEREIPKESLDIYMTSPPCQAFSMAGKRLGKNDKRGILFFNSYEFIKENKPRFFIFENVKGLLSDDGGRTFQEWLNLLGGKSVNGLPILFPYDDTLPYHIYYHTLNAKSVANVPQNRDRVFIIGIRDDVDNSFTFPKGNPLTKRLSDVLESDVEDKYFLSDQALTHLIKADRAIGFTDRESKEYANCVVASYHKRPTDGEYIYDIPKMWIADYRNDEGLRIRKDNISPCMTSRRHSETDPSTMPPLVGAIRGRNPENPTSREVGLPTEQRLELNINGTSNALTTVQKDNVVVSKSNIRRLTPRECFRLMDFPETFTWKCSDTQAYRQAGNSIVVGVLCEIIKKFKI